MTLRIGSLCSGYAGLDLAAEQVTGGTTVWHCEYEAAPSALLAARFPGVPNFHDVKELAWADVPVDVLTAGYPCQPFSGAGKRLGTEDPRHLFPWIARGVERMRPALLLLENVRGHLSLGFDVVLAELDRIGYDVRWTLLRAADIGAPHGRSRLWIVARAREAGGWPAPVGHPSGLLAEGVWSDPESGLFGNIPAACPGTAGVMVRGVRWDSEASVADVGPHLLPTPNAAKAGSDMTLTCSGDGRETPNKLGWAVALLPTPVADNSRGLPQRGTDFQSLPNAVVALLPTPDVNDMGSGKTVEDWDAWTDAQKAKHGNGNGHGASLHIEAARHGGTWGPYSAAVARWEALTRPAPAPTEEGRSGPRLAPAFVEWMQGLPDGWVTDPALGLTRNQQLTMLGNGVVPQCAAAAYRLLGVPLALEAVA